MQQGLTRIDCEEVSAGGRRCPVKVPVIVRPDRHPTSLLEVADDHRLVDVDAVRDAGTHFDVFHDANAN